MIHAMQSNIFDLVVPNSLRNLLNNDPLELCLMNGEQEQPEDLAVRAMITQLNNTPNWKNEGHFEDMNRSAI